MLCYSRINFLVAILFLTTPSWGDAEPMNQGILSQSKIKESSLKQALSEIKKTLPKQLRKCPIEITDIKLLTVEHDAATEDWTVSACQETKVYCVQAYWLKGSYFVGVKPKEEVFAFQKALWETAKKTGHENEWRDTLFYIDEIETMNQDKKNKSGDIQTK